MDQFLPQLRHPAGRPAVGVKAVLSHQPVPGRVQRGHHGIGGAGAVEKGAGSYVLQRNTRHFQNLSQPARRRWSK